MIIYTVPMSYKKIVEMAYDTRSKRRTCKYMWILRSESTWRDASEVNVKCTYPRVNSN